MQPIEVRDMTPADEAYVAGSSPRHIVEQLDEDGCVRLARYRELAGQGLRVKVALCEGRYAGLASALPIELCPWCATGHDLMALPCLYVHQQPEDHGVGRALVAAVEEEARTQHKKGVVVVAFRDDFWPVDVPYFKEIDYRPVGRYGTRVVLWKPYAEDAEPPLPVRRRYRFRPVRGKVVVDLFHNTLCRASVIEARRVREIVARAGNIVLLREHCTDDRAVLLEFGIPRGIFVNGREQSWGHTAPAAALAEIVSREILRTMMG